MKKTLSLKLDLPSYYDVDQLFLFTSKSELSFDKLKKMYETCDLGNENLLLTKSNFQKIADFLNDPENKKWLCEELAKINDLNMIGKINKVFIESYHTNRNEIGRIKLIANLEIEDDRVFNEIEKEKENFIQEIKSSDPEKINKLSLKFKEMVDIENIYYSTENEEVNLVMSVSYVMNDFEKEHLDFYKKKRMMYNVKHNKNQTVIKVKKPIEVKVKK